MNYGKKFLQFFTKLNPRERALVGFTAICLFATGIYLFVEEVQAHIGDTERLITRREQQLEKLPPLLQRYRTLKARLEKMQTTFAEAEMSFEEVTAQLDKIVRESIGSDSYDLKKSRSPTQIGFEYEKQEFTLKVKSLSLEQVVSLLHKLEQGESPLFLGKVDLLKSSNGQDFSATLEIFSVRKS